MSASLLIIHSFAKQIDMGSKLSGPIPDDILAQKKLMMCMAAVAGFCDSYGLLYFRTYVSFMSGNSTQAGFSLGKQDYYTALLAFTAILFFSLGIFTASIAVGCAWYRPRWMPFVFVSFLLKLCATLVYFFHPDKHIG